MKVSDFLEHSLDRHVLCVKPFGCTCIGALFYLYATLYFFKKRNGDTHLLIQLGMVTPAF